MSVERTTRALVLAALLGGATGLGQQAPSTRLLRLGDFSAATEVLYETTNRKYTTKQGGATTQYSTSGFHTLLDLGFRGYAYHPRLLDFSGTIGFELDRANSSITTPGEDRDRSFGGVAPRYNLTGVVLGQHPGSLLFGLARQQTVVAGGAGDLAVVDARRENAVLRIRSDPFPVELYYSHVASKEEQLGFGEGRDDESTTVGFTMHHYAGNSTSRLNCERFDRRENVVSASDVLSRYATEQRVQSLSLSNRLVFGARDQHALTSQVDHRQDTGTAPYERFSAGEMLSLSHTRNLRTSYDARYTRDTVGLMQSDLVTAGASLHHQLYESLSTTLEAHGSQQDFNASSRSIQGGSATWAYRKRIPHGTLFVDLGAGREVTDEQGPGGVVPVLGEGHVLSNITTVFLNNPNVILSTVVVRNVANELCILDVDYRLIPQGSFVEIRRVASSIRIPDGGSVTVDYSYNSGGPVKYATRNTHWRAQVDLFDQLSLFAGVRTTKQDLISGFDAGRLQDITDTLYGAEFRWNPFRLRAEHQIYDSTQTPYTSDSLSLDVSHAITPRQHLSAHAAARRVRYGGGGTSSYNSLSGTYSVQPTLAATIHATVGFERFDDRGNAGTYAYARLDATWRIRSTHFSLSWSIRQRDDVSVREVSDAFMFSIRRNF
ncbi:MAG: hypothetical protein FJ290_07755 [Planctomycetes bacterium]|nr:hypothetical protein [Planctomycetota bacterium]